MYQNGSQTCAVWWISRVQEPSSSSITLF